MKLPAFFRSFPSPTDNHGYDHSVPALPPLHHGNHFCSLCIVLAQSTRIGKPTCQPGSIREERMPKVSVVVPAYNARKYLAECLESVCAQTFTDWELIVVDDGSTDDTAAIARPYCERDPRIRLHTQENGGVASARNRGLALADPQMEYFLFLDQDDFLHVDSLETLLGALESAESASAVYGLPQAVNECGRPLSDDVSQAFGYARLKVSGGGMTPLDEGVPPTFAGLVIWPCIATHG